MDQSLAITVRGHVLITDDEGNVLLDRDNAIHPQNMARVISRALSNEHNFHIHRIAFGNAGTKVDSAFNIAYEAPNDGIQDNGTWTSRLYNETYSEIIDESNIDFGTDPGSGDRLGGGANPDDDPISEEHISGPGVRSIEKDIISEVVITSVLNPGEPSGQTDSDGNTTDPDSDFTFDEIGLYTTGAPYLPAKGYQDIDVGNKIYTDETGLDPSVEEYKFSIDIDGSGTPTIITVNASLIIGTGLSGAILFSDLRDYLNGITALSGVTVVITDDSLGSQSYGFLRFERVDAGVGTSVLLVDGPALAGYEFFKALNPLGVDIVKTSVSGVDAGFQNDPVNFTTERERLLTHIIFSPVLKSGNRTLTITYTLTVSVAQTV